MYKLVYHETAGVYIWEENGVNGVLPFFHDNEAPAEYSNGERVW